jgi:hypothetical protein
MRRIVICLTLMLFPGAALAAEGWIAEMEEDEGGPVMVAYVEAAPTGDVTPMLRTMCFGGDFTLRYETSTITLEPGTEADFVFKNESTQITKHMALEEMDGAFAAYFPASDPMVALLKTGTDVTVTESKGIMPAQSFSLKGSSKAIATLLKNCN